MSEHARHTPLPAGERESSRSEQGEGLSRRGQTPDHLLSRSRRLRRQQTEAETRLWSRLRAKRLHGLKFRRQVPIGNYIADFVCPGAKLVVEVDGSQHADDSGYDARRTEFLEREGYRVLRFWNNEVLAETDSVIEKIAAVATAPLPGPAGRSLSPEGEGS